MGLERYYDDILQPKQNSYIKGLRDVKGRIIYDNTAIIQPRKDGDNLYLNINLVLQGKIEKILDKQKENLKAAQILSVVMESKTGKIIAIASSNRYNPMQIRQKDISSLKMGHIQYTYEPGSVMKPITLAMLLKYKKVNIYEILNAHNGIFYFKKHFTIYDDEKFKWLNVIQAVIHSSNIVFAQLGLRLTSKEFRDGLLSFGFGQKTGIDLPYEYKGVIFLQKDLISEIHRASNSFGYAMQVNLIQLLQAYNTFNNDGILISPKIAYKYANNPIPTTKRVVLSPAIAQTILNILRKVVLEGTAKATNIKGLFIAGKTGTAKISENGQYIKGLYNSSFIGFANDKTHKYTIATLVIRPNPKRFFASQTAVVVFRDIVNTMIDMELLKPN
jgi:cell division protein FtsI (penicillin-binding protein 3)